MSDVRGAMRIVALECIHICEAQAAQFEEGPTDATGWPMTLDGVARHQSLALADLIRESLEHETLARLIDSAPCDSGRHAQRGDANAAPSEGCQSGGAEGAASPNPSINQETPHAR